MFQTVTQAGRVFWSSAVLAKRALFAWLNPGLWIMQLFFMSVFQIAFFVYVVRYVQGSEATVAYVAIGNAISSIAYVTVFSVCNITGEEKQQGTLQPVLVTPANRLAMFTGRAMFQVVNGIATVFIALGYAAFLFGVNFGNTDWIALTVVITLTAFTMTLFGLMLSSVGLYLRTSMVLANIFLFLGLLVSGVNFPVTQLPGWLQPIGYAMPLTYATDAARMAVDGAGLSEMGGLLFNNAILGLAWLLVGYIIFRVFENLSRRLGTMEKY
ncbi:MAG: ABC-2 type transporter [Methanomassiliicoccales archaeon PtaU1.Bin124]|nr:MAG: ABC-2 type transporter [Methanomassiliicoccales archaeon PtaU1.Bin124]